MHPPVNRISNENFSGGFVFFVVKKDSSVSQIHGRITHTSFFRNSRLILALSKGDSLQ